MVFNMLDFALIQQCSPDIHPAIANAIVKTESSFNNFAIGVNGGRVKQPKNYQEAVITAKKLLAENANIDLGLAQINSSNLSWLGLSVEQIFDTCANLKAMQTVYNYCYSKAGENGLGTRMQRAFSCYNTGNTQTGFKNGYVNKATKNLNEIVAKINGKALPIQPMNQLPTDGKQLALYAEELNKIKQVEANDNHIETIDVGEQQEVQVQAFNSWDVFKDF